MNLEPSDPEVIAARSSVKIASCSASLLDAGKPRVKDYSMMDPSRVVRIILMPVLCYLKLRLRSRSIL